MIESAEKDVQKKLDYVYHKEKSGKSQFLYRKKTGHSIGVIMREKTVVCVDIIGGGI
jgi:hypothetical protein